MGHAGILFYVLAYTFMNLGAFGVLILLARRGEELNRIEDLQGLASRQPGAAAMMAIFMLSLGGIPPTAGFMGKFYLFLGAVHAHQYGLAVIGLVASVIGVVLLPARHLHDVLPCPPAASSPPAASGASRPARMWP